MRLLCLPTLNVDGHTDQGVYSNIMYAPLQVKLEVLTLVAEELALLHNDTDLLWKPSWGSPKRTMLGAVDSSVEHEHRRHASNTLARSDWLVPLAPTAPAS